MSDADKLQLLERAVECMSTELLELRAWRRTVEHRITLQGTKCNVAMAVSGQARELLRQLVQEVERQAAGDA